MMLGLPWSALPLDDSRYLLQEREVEVLPSLAAAARSASWVGPDRDWSVLAVTTPAVEMPDLPALPHAAEETRRVAAIYGATPTGGNRFTTATAFAAEIDRHEILHFAGHAVSSGSNPQASHLVLTPSFSAPVVVYPADLEGPRFERLQVVVLSACSSFGAPGDLDTGLSGLARPFLLRGARAVIGTLWPLDDEVALEAFSHFHRVLRAGASPAGALRAAQLQLLSSPVARFRDPAAWAGLVIVGGPGPPQPTTRNRR